MTTLLTNSSFRLIGVDGIRRRDLGESKIFEALPVPPEDRAHWLENHITEVLDGVPAGAGPGRRPRRDYDATTRSLRQRLLTKEDELQEPGTLKRLTRTYETQGIVGLIGQKANPPPARHAPDEHSPNNPMDRSEPSTPSVPVN